MSVEYGAPNTVRNAFDKEGRKAPPHIVELSGTDNSVITLANGLKNRVNQVLNCRGAGLVMITPNSAGVGDCKSDAPNKRATASFATQSGDLSQPTLVALCCSDGGGITIDGGGGRQSTILACTSSGKGSISITDNAISLCVGGTEFVVYADGRVTSTYSVVQERNRGGGTVNPPSSGKAVA